MSEYITRQYYKVRNRFLRDSHKRRIIGVCYTKLRKIGDSVAFFDIAGSKIVTIEAEFDRRPFRKGFQYKFVSGTIGNLERKSNNLRQLNFRFYTNRKIYD